MTDCTVAAPVRATKAPARSKAAPTTPQPKPQWLDLGLQHVRRLSDLIYSLVDVGDGDKAQGLIQELVEAAEGHLCSIAHEGSPVDVSLDGVLYCQVSMVVTMLEGAWYAAEHGPLGHPPPLHEAVIPAAIAYAKSLVEALQEAPRTDKLQALTQPSPATGTKAHRDRSQPPIQRASVAGDMRLLADEAICINLLVEWVTYAQTILTDLQLRAGWDEQFSQLLEKAGHRINYADWGACRMDEAIAYALGRQFVLIKQMEGGAA